MIEDVKLSATAGGWVFFELYLLLKIKEKTYYRTNGRGDLFWNKVFMTTRSLDELYSFVRLFLPCCSAAGQRLVDCTEHFAETPSNWTVVSITSLRVSKPPNSVLRWGFKTQASRNIENWQRTPSEFMVMPMVGEPGQCRMIDCIERLRTARWLAWSGLYAAYMEGLTLLGLGVA